MCTPSNISFPSADFSPDIPSSFPSLWPQRIALGIFLFKTNPPPGLLVLLFAFSRALRLHTPLFPVSLLSFYWFLPLGLWTSLKNTPNNLPLTLCFSQPSSDSLLLCWVFRRTVLLCALLYLMSLHFLSPLPSSLPIPPRALWSITRTAQLLSPVEALSVFISCILYYLTIETLFSWLLWPRSFLILLIFFSHSFFLVSFLGSFPLHAP